MRHFPFSIPTARQTAALVAASVRSRWTWLRFAIAIVLVGLLSLAWPLPDAADESTGVVSLQVTDRYGTLLREIRPNGRGRPVPLTAIDASVRNALIATEDKRFYQHIGVDPFAIARAAWSNLKAGRVVSGASTLTMQVARLLRNDASRGLWDKIAEMHLALRLEARWSKDRILSTWLNRVSYGNQTHGIEAAAQLYFGKSALDLTLAESAFLVGLPQSPTRYDPFRHLNRAQKRQQRVIRAMADGGALSQEQAKRMTSLPLDLIPREQVFRAPHFTEWLRISKGLDDPDHPLLASLRNQGDPELPQRKNQAPVELRTTLDYNLQSAVAGFVQARVRALTVDGVTNGAAVVIENRTGAIRAYVGSADFWNPDAGGQNDGVRMLRQPGSALKPFTYGRAMESRLHTAASILPDIELNVPEAGGAFSPANYDKKLHGPTPLREALANSYNIPAVRAAQSLGAPVLLRTLRSAGLTTLNRNPEHYGVGLTLGNGEVRPIDLARAYAGIARGGLLPGVHGVQWTRTASKDTLHLRPPAAQRMELSGGTLRILTDILADPTARAEAFGRHGPLELPFPVAAKTGTSKDYRDNWVAGFTPTHTVVVWVGNFDGSPMRRVSGVTGAGPLFKSIMMHLGPGGAFPDPARAGLTATTICPASGHRPGTHCTAPRREWFLPGTAPTDTCTVHQVVAIDARSGLLATDQTPASAVEKRRFTVYPEIYHSWLRDQGIPIPPAITHADARAPASASDWTRTEQLQIRYPLPGADFHIDPVLRDSFQQIHLRGTAPNGWHDVHWVIDGSRRHGDYRDARWRLVEGRHTLSLRAIAPDGSRYQSLPAEIYVHDLPRSAGWAVAGDQ